MPPGPFTATGVVRSVVVPSPTWPLLFSPHAQTVPSERTASDVRETDPTATTPVRTPGLPDP